MKILAAILTMLAMVLPSWSATVYPASTNGNNRFTGSNTFVGPLIATNLYSAFSGNGGGLTNLMITNLMVVAPVSDTNLLYIANSTVPNVDGLYTYFASSNSWLNGAGTVWIITNSNVAGQGSGMAILNAAHNDLGADWLYAGLVSVGCGTLPVVTGIGNDTWVDAAANPILGMTSVYGTDQVDSAVFTASGTTIISTNMFVFPNLTANLSTSTNAGLSSLDNTAYQAVLKGMLYSFPSNVNQSLVQRVADKIARNENLNVLLYGNGLMEIMFPYINTNFLALRSYSGRLLDGEGGYAPIFTGTADTVATPDSVSFMFYYRLNANGDTIKFNTVNYADGSPRTTLGDILQIVYVATNTAGHFCVYTNASAGTWAKAFTDVDATSGYGARVLSITNPVPIRWGWILSNNVAGVNLILATGFYNTKTNGFSYELVVDSAAIGSMALASPLIRGPMLAAMRADLILMNTIVNSADMPGSIASINTLLNDIKTYSTNSLLAYLSEWPLNSSALTADQYAFNQVVRTNAINNKFAYFDGLNVFGNYNTWTNRGFGAIDGTHASASGYDFACNLIYTWLGLNKGGDYLTWNSPTNVVGTGVTGQLPVNVNGRTYYIDLKE